MSKNDEIKKLKEKIEELEFVKDFQQCYCGYGNYYRCLFIKKIIAKNISKRDLNKETKPFKRKWFVECFGISK